jgi:hypothetical protein
MNRRSGNPVASLLRAAAGTALAALAMNWACAQAPADAQAGPFGDRRHFAYRDGGQLYRAI